MAITLSSNTSRALECLVPSSHSHPLFARPTNLVLPRHHHSRSTLAFSRRRNNNPAITSSSKKKKQKSVVEEDLDDDDPFEALFSQLEEDLKNDDASNNDDDDDDDDDDDGDLNEEDIEMLARELEEVLGAGGDDIEMFDSAEDDEMPPVKLKNWQIRRLAHALKTGRRKTSIKNLSAELCLDRAVVLHMLRDPPPNLVMMSAALPDEPAPTALVSERETKHTEIFPMETTVDTLEEPKTKVKEPVHVMQHKWSAQKRLKKVHVGTLESVYKRSKRPTNTMISSIVHLTNLPRKRVIKWFEDKRAEDGVPDHRQPYQRSVPESVFSR